MQSLATALCKVCRYLRASGILEWSPIGNLLCAHPEPVELETVIDQFVRDLTTTDIRTDPPDTHLTPTRTIPFLGFRLDISADLTFHLPSRVTETDRLLATLQSGLPLTYVVYRREAPALCFVALVPPPSAFILCDSGALVFTARAGQGHALPWALSVQLLFLFAQKSLAIKEVPSHFNLAGAP